MHVYAMMDDVQHRHDGKMNIYDVWFLMYRMCWGLMMQGGSNDGY